MKIQKNVFLFIALIVIAAASRLLPHPPNFTALGALALFGGASISNKFLKVVLPIGALLLSDLILNNTLYLNETGAVFYPGIIWVYSAFVIISLMASLLKKINVVSVLGSSVLAALFFFLFTNFGYWMSGVLYPLTLEGLITCYEMAIPFFGNTLMSTVLYGALFFGGYYWVDSRLLSPVKVEA